MAKTLVVVAHRAGARFLVRDGLGALELIEAIDHPQGRLHDSDIKSDRPGRTHDSGGTRHAMEPQESPGEHDAARFARTLAHRISTLRHEHQYDELVLAAPADFLGELKGSLDAATARTLKGSASKDFAHVPTHELLGAVRNAGAL
jgi:protein required for attachment to host cells